MEEVDGSEILAIPRHICEFTGDHRHHLSLALEVSAHLDVDIASQNPRRGFDSGKILMDVKGRLENQRFGRSVFTAVPAKETEKIIGIAGGG